MGDAESGPRPDVRPDTSRKRRERMSVSEAPTFVSPIEYPEDDGQPMSDNSKQFRWIQVIEGNLEAVVRDQPDVVVAGNMLWYPREGHSDERNAPDVMVIFGRPKGDR